MKNLDLYLQKLTTKPGVYQMYDGNAEILYVGKASNLKKRVSSYFSKQSISTKTQSLVSQIDKIKVTITRSETEALLLESSLIKTLRPKYNVLLRDDKSYPYLHITGNHEFPRMEIMRSKKKPTKGNYFGPYPSAHSIRGTLSAIQKIFKIRNCTDSYFRARTRPCLQYQIKRCSAPCTRYISKEEYQQNISDAIKFLEGHSQHILINMEKRMQQSVDALDFEQAARIRDQIKDLRLVQEQQGMVHLRGDVDVIVVDAKVGFACIQCVTIRDGQVLASQSFFPKVPKVILEDSQNTMNKLWQQVFHAFLQHYYVDVPERIPACLITNHPVMDKDNFETLLSDLRGKKCVIQTRPRGVKARWLDFALNNLRLAVEDKVNSEAVIQERYDALESFLELSGSIKRMECFDISHTQGSETVASCVVFGESGPSKKDYRRYNISDITPGDDYAAMNQVLRRRFKHGIEDAQLPDVLIIDGGKGQVAVAEKVLTALNITSVLLLGVAKGPSRKAGWEQLILSNKKRAVSLPPESKALHLLQHIRDEAHRFAITFHRKKRSKTGLSSTLESIPGVGHKRRRALLLRFGGLKELKRAPVDEISKVPGISLELAERIYQHLNRL